MRKTQVITAVVAALAIAVSGALPAAAGMMWSTFLGGSGIDEVDAVTSDVAGNIYVVGTTNSTNFPTTGEAFRSTAGGYGDVVVAKLSHDGRTLMWSALLGGSSAEVGRAIALDGSGNVYVTGLTASRDFTVTPGAFRTTHGGWYDGFVTKLTQAGGALVYSTFLGSSGLDSPTAIQVDGSGNAVVAGFTSSYGFPVTLGAVKPARRPIWGDAADGFITKLNASGSGLVYSTFIGTDNSMDVISGLALDSSGQPIVTGWTY